MKKTIYFLFVICHFSFFINSSYAGLSGKINKGNSYYRQGKFDKALEKYRDAQISNPESPEVHFNLGAALYKQENYEEAMKEFGKTTYGKDIILESKSYYNVGNCLYRMGKLPESIQYYKKALELNPKDEDAKYNIEFVQRKIKENIDQQSKNPQNQQQTQQQQSKSGQGKDDKNKQQDKQQQEKDKQKGQQQEQPKPEKKKEMSKEDADRILQALEDQEKDAQKRRQMQTQQMPQVEYDW